MVVRVAVVRGRAWRPRGRRRGVSKLEERLGTASAVLGWPRPKIRQASKATHAVVVFVCSRLVSRSAISRLQLGDFALVFSLMRMLVAGLSTTK